MKKTSFPALWLLFLIVGLPQFSEGLYTPSLPDVASFLSIKKSWAEYTLTVYLMGIGIGTLFWGKLSDTHGRKPCMLIGLTFYILGCVGCYFSVSIFMLMISRLVQAFGGSACIVLGHAMCRDTFSGSKRGKAFSTMGVTVASLGAIGSMAGGVLDQYFGWASIFLLLIFLGLCFLGLSFVKITETLALENRGNISILATLKEMIKDSRVICFALIIGGSHGLGFSYYAEGPFYFQLLGLTPSLYGLSLFFVVMSAAMGAYLARRLHDRLLSPEILNLGSKIIVIGSASFVGCIILGYFLEAPRVINITISLIHMMGIMVGNGIILPTGMSLALEKYKNNIGTASALFGFFYYATISLCTFGMGCFHNDTLFPMPLYFLGISFVIRIIFKRT